MSLLAPALLCLALAALPDQSPSEAQAAQDGPREQQVEAPDTKPPTPKHTGVLAVLDGVKDDIRNLPSMAASRLHDNRHYLSDVVFGAAIGSIAGRTVTQHGRDTWSVAPAAVPGGVAIVAARAGF